MLWFYLCENSRNYRLTDIDRKMSNNLGMEIGRRKQREIL